MPASLNPIPHNLTVILAGLAGGTLTFVAAIASQQVTLLGSALLSGIATCASALVGAAAATTERRPSLWIAGILILLLGWPAFHLNQRHAPPGVAELVGGCRRFTVYAQNRWPPAGAAKRATPRPDADKVGGYEPNELIAVDGWVRTQPAHPTNPSPWDSDVWFHVADGSGWVAFAAVRAHPTPLDPTGLSKNGGQPVPTHEACAGIVRWP
ncbi:MAG: hypothetical protein QM619_03190 [Micropruina sp.]|uniref:hypothetical protein n=1 Tax=Micropruina sp. TaxID=2737536 RepID=UPI0039E4C587